METTAENPILDLLYLSLFFHLFSFISPIPGLHPTPLPFGTAPPNPTSLAGVDQPLNESPSRPLHLFRQPLDLRLQPFVLLRQLLHLPLVLLLPLPPALLGGRGGPRSWGARGECTAPLRTPLALPQPRRNCGGWGGGGRRRRAVYQRGGLRGWSGGGGAGGVLVAGGRLVLADRGGRGLLAGVVAVAHLGTPCFHQSHPSLAQQLKELRGQQVSPRLPTAVCRRGTQPRGGGGGRRRGRGGSVAGQPLWFLLHNLLDPFAPHLAICQPGEGAAFQDIQELRLLLGEKWKNLRVIMAHFMWSDANLAQIQITDTDDLFTSGPGGARACLAPPVSEPRISCRSSYHASSSAPHSGPTPGGYGGGKCSHSAVISPNSRNVQICFHTGTHWTWSINNNQLSPHIFNTNRYVESWLISVTKMHNKHWEIAAPRLSRENTAPSGRSLHCINSKWHSIKTRVLRKTQLFWQRFFSLIVILDDIQSTERLYIWLSTLTFFFKKKEKYPVNQVCLCVVGDISSQNVYGRREGGNQNYVITNIPTPKAS